MGLRYAGVDEVGVVWLDWVHEVRRWLRLLLEGNRVEEHLAFLGSLSVYKSSSAILVYGDQSMR